MSSRLSLSNLVQSISWNQFQALVANFAEHCTTSFGCECNIEIRAMNALKVFTTHWPDDHVIEYMRKLNEKNTFFTTDSASLLTPEIFASAVFIEVFVRPDDKARAPTSAFGMIDFKGKLRRRATFYLQPVDKSLIEKLKKANPLMTCGNGSAHHCDPG